MNQQAFTLGQIAAAHAMVKSGSDFPNYIRDIGALGVRGYDTYVEDGHSVFKGSNGYVVAGPPKYGKLQIAESANITSFQKNLKEHQEGGTDYIHFCQHCAADGIDKWTVSLESMTCTYFDSTGNQVLAEHIPQ